MEENQTTGADTPKKEEAKEIPQIEISPLEEAKTILIENRKLLAELTDERKKIEKAAAEMLMNGRSFAGQTPQVETADQKWAREAKVRYAGTGMCPA